MKKALAEQWKAAFLATVQQDAYAHPLKEASLKERLGAWTETLTAASITTCEALRWRAAAKGHKLPILPIQREEYLALDVMSFAGGDRRWRFPTAVIELENSKRDDCIAYSLWKVLCVRAELRIVYCYRRSPDQSPSLVRHLGNEVVNSLSITDRTQLAGETILVVGSRDESAVFPYGFFKWWRLETATGTFRLF